MSTTINNHQLKNFILDKIGQKLDKKEAEELDIEKQYSEVADEIDVEEIEIDDILDNESLYEQFAVLYTEEKEQKSAVKDKEKDKEEQTKVKDKNKSGV